MPDLFSHLSRFACAAIAIALLVAISGCGDDDKSSASKEQDKSGNQADQAFLKAMVPHHESAVAMAQVAVEKGEHKEAQGLGRSIIETQSQEIAQMSKLHSEIYGQEITPDEKAAGELGLSMEEAGMMHGGMDPGEKIKKGPIVDKVFIDEMVPHHQGAILMARAVQSKGQNPEVKKLAATIIAEQTKEIEQMNSWRKDWYGAESPAGGVPTGSDTESKPPAEDSGEHGSGHE
ncbi:MAG: DUF305 domain-containing protein [Thermoleophilaceae bacterium]|nr:DUF305 domain-containing protein [Thermoleophilaceae bacterium]